MLLSEGLTGEGLILNPTILSNCHLTFVCGVSYLLSELINQLVGPFVYICFSCQRTQYQT